MNQITEQLIGFFISDAAAQTASGGAQSPMGSILMMVGMFVIFYFLLIRPQQKRQKEHKNMVAGLAKGDEVVTMGGGLGKITALDDNFISLEIAKGVEVKVQRQSVHAMMPKGTV